MKHTGQSSSAEEKSLISLSIISFIRRATRTYTTICFLFIGSIHKNNDYFVLVKAVLISILKNVFVYSGQEKIIQLEYGEHLH